MIRMDSDRLVSPYVSTRSLVSNTTIQRRPADYDPLLMTPGAAGAPGMNNARPRSIGSSPRDLLFTLFWHRRKIAWFFLIGMTLTALSVLLLPSTYRSESTLLVKLGGELVDPAVGLGQQTVQPVIYRDSQMKTELELLKSETIAEAVVEELGAARILRKASSAIDDKEARGKALLAIERNLKVEVIPESSILSIAYESGDLVLAHDITESYVKQYITHRSDVYANQASLKALNVQNDDVKKTLIKLMSDIKTMKQKAGIADIATERLIVQNRQGELRKQISDAEVALHVATAQVTVLDEQRKHVPEFLESGAKENGPVSDLKKTIFKLEAELAEKRSVYKENSITLKSLQQQINDLNEKLATEMKNGGDILKERNPAFQKIDQDLLTANADLSVKKATQDVLKTEITKCETRLKEIDDLEGEIKGKLVVVGATEEQIRSLESASSKAALISGSSAANQISINQKATMPLRAVAPNRLMLLMLGAFVALSGAIGLGLVTEALSRTAKRPEDIDRISHVPSVSVPVVDVGVFVGNGSTNANGVNRGSRVTRMLPGTNGSSDTTLTHSPGSNDTAIDIRPARRWSPQLLQSAHGVIDGLLFDAIRDHKEEKSFVTGVIACRPGQGATTMASYIASAIADRLEASIPIHPDDRVLLVDTDMQEPSLHRVFHTPETPGLGDWLSHTNTTLPVNDYICPTSHPRLSLMPAGQTANLMRLLDRADLLITSASGGYRHIVIDLPAVSVSPTCLRLAAKCDAVLLVVESGGIHQEVVRRSIQALQNAGANVVGVVLNKRRYPIPDWLYERA